MSITTHILDISAGKPAADVSVRLEYQDGSLGWQKVGEGMTNSDGRQPALAPDALLAGNYRLIFETGAYYAARGIECFYPDVTVSFTVHDGAEHYHVPLLLSPFGYSTYRGS